jgi:tetratricopeptide (TPR) repeat protein
MRFVAAAFAVLLVWGQGIAAHAETCPDVPDEEVALRRSMAKEWFAKAEEAEAAGDKQAAVRRYACSLGLAPHPSTAYNLGTVAEKSGDLSMALDGFRSYLKLAPEATDRPAIEARIVGLEAKVAELRQQLAAPPAVPVAPAPAAAVPAMAPAAPGADATAPAGVVVTAPADRAHARHVAGWISLAAGAASLGTAILFNVVARGKMSDCYNLYDEGLPADQALSHCRDAKPFAYGSYALFGAAGVLGAVGAALILWRPAPTADEPPADVALVPVAGGGASFVASGRF